MYSRKIRNYVPVLTSLSHNFLCKFIFKWFRVFCSRWANFRLGCVIILIIQQTKLSNLKANSLFVKFWNVLGYLEVDYTSFSTLSWVWCVLYRKEFHFIGMAAFNLITEGHMRISRAVLNKPECTTQSKMVYDTFHHL